MRVVLSTSTRQIVRETVRKQCIIRVLQTILEWPYKILSCKTVKKYILTVRMIAGLTILIALIKAYIDHKRWPFTNHAIGFIIVAILILFICFLFDVVYPIFLFNVIFNPAINLMRRLPLFYLGDTAFTDLILKEYLGPKAGLIYFLINLLLLILTL